VKSEMLTSVYGCEENRVRKKVSSSNDTAQFALASSKGIFLPSDTVKSERRSVHTMMLSKLTILEDHSKEHPAAET
jgi:hypothetical protein